MIKRFLRKIFGIKEPKKPASATAKSRLETLIRAESRAASPRQATSGSGRRKDTGDDANDLLNPLNVLSPLSPVSPLNPLNQVDEPFNRQRVENDAVSRAGHHDHGDQIDRFRKEPDFHYGRSHSQSHKPHDESNYRHTYTDMTDRQSHSHSHNFGGGHSHSHSSHDSGSYDSGSSDSGGGGGGGSD